MSNGMESRPALKDQLFNREKIERLAAMFHAADRTFRKARFVAAAIAPFESLELKQRIAHIATTLERHLDADFRVAAKQIVAALPAPLDPTKTDNDFGDFIFAPLGEYVARHGLQRRFLPVSLRTLKELTQRFSMEDAIRGFINEFPEETLAELVKWASDKNYHVRRLVSEGTRPILPWSRRLCISHQIPLPLLDRLHADPTRYVTRSVANHLNDISKSDPDIVLATLQRWSDDQRQQPAELHWMTKHALRTLVKQGHTGALERLGCPSQPRVRIGEFTVNPPEVMAGDAFEISLSLFSEAEQQLVIDYEVNFAKASGKRSGKVFKLKQLPANNGQQITLRKRHILRANATTYKLYPGMHHVTLKINGQAFGTKSFELVIR